jgi:hypothetical protein
MTEHEDLEDEVGVDAAAQSAPATEEPAAAPPPLSTAPPTTGHPAVDEVLRSLDALAGQPVDEHVAAFEEAHASLRRALSDAGDDTP